ncbi:MAG: hypothetical protein JW957_09000 [Candidatus Omnitrophica bacterium]|nr:hypothetical protein [Candidatus Omnitrophota bacterium]
MKKGVGILFAIVLLVFSGCRSKGTTEGTVIPLTEAQIKEALDLGAKNSELSIREFTADWTVDIGYGESRGSTTIITPFLRVALLGKEAALAGKKPDDRTINAVLKEEVNHITFNVTLFGGYPQFGRSVKFILRHGEEEISPDYMFMPPYSQMGRDYTQSATGSVKFKKESVPENAKVILVATFNVDPETADVHTCKFEFDLSKYK